MVQKFWGKKRGKRSSFSGTDSWKKNCFWGVNLPRTVKKNSVMMGTSVDFEPQSTSPYALGLKS